MPPTLLDLLIIFLKVVGVLVLIDLVLMYLIWRVRGIHRAQERRRRGKIAKRRFLRAQEEARRPRIPQQIQDEPTIEFLKPGDERRMMHRAIR